MFCQHVCLCTVCIFDAHRGQKRALGPLNLELGMVVSWYVCAKKWAQVLCVSVYGFVHASPMPTTAGSINPPGDGVKGDCKLSCVGAASWTLQKLELTSSAKTMHRSLNSPSFSLSSPSLLFKQDYSKDGIHYYLKLTLNCFLLVFRDLRVCYRTQIPDLLWCRWAISVPGCTWKERSEFKSTLTAEVWRSLEDSAQKTG